MTPSLWIMKPRSVIHKAVCRSPVIHKPPALLPSTALQQSSPNSTMSTPARDALDDKVNQVFAG